MEKKNTILLTVIAIATLLVAVVGATFAYFTASVTTKNDENNTVTAKTFALTSVEMDYGSEVKGEGIYPGTTLAKNVTIKANCPEGETTCEPVDTVITITTTDDKDEAGESIFGNDIKWTLFKMDSNTAEITCNAEEKVEGGKYYTLSTCDGFDSEAGTLVGGTKVDSGIGAGEKKINIKAYGVANGSIAKTDDKYYLMVEYLDNETLNEDGTPVQNAQQGHAFSVTLNFASKAS